MALKKRTSVAFLSLTAVSMLALSACGGSTAASGASGAAGSGSSGMTSSAARSGSMTTANPAADLVGPGCAAYAAQVPTGAGSVNGMTADPVAVAASNNPLLTTLTAAVSGKLNPKVDLVSTLDGSEFTVFAPVDSAFAKLDPATLESLKTDDATLSKILTYHVLPGQITPDKLSGEHKTVEGGTVTVTGSKDDLKIDGANVICGGVHTANATVYLIDSVLSPK
ncbi:fasciclin domain-containing protein [Paenarthrobacter sp. PH39-S1]|uniref:fasciclin domain-containing protein n=1 Tax=Paenarthrobacter sp. PH39-S1 TaxID=3046204 RepID=UPI0024B8A96F|nr:fasciclin domain-containing protein [Paenarthrobacter sp. PH39-S1]MDJ0356524.1 fasciclin domain-containing protein [Paenarthrobacter sp. PH39-S1]